MGGGFEADWVPGGGTYLEGTDKDGYKIKYKQCINWPYKGIFGADSYKGCMDRPRELNAGWYRCLHKQDPGRAPSLGCEFSPSFNCANAFECYAVLSRDPPPAPKGQPGELWTECKRDEDWGKGTENDWGALGLSTKMHAAAECASKPEEFKKVSIRDCGNWYFNATCSEPSACKLGDAECWSKPYSNESARKEGFGFNRDAAMLKSCQDKGYDNLSTTWEDLGNWTFRTKCRKVKWSKMHEVRDGRNWKVQLMKCDDWKHATECKDNYMKGKNPAAPKKDSVIKWSQCAVGSSPGGKFPGFGATACSPFTADATKGCTEDIQECYAVLAEYPGVDYYPESNKPAIDETTTGVKDAKGYIRGCDGAGTIVTIRRCDNWPDNDPKYCANADPKNPAYPRLLQDKNGVISQEKKDAWDKADFNWIRCGLGSSPGGIDPQNNARACSPASKDINCAWGQNCYAVLKTEKDESCKADVFTDPFAAVIEGINEAVEAAQLAVLAIGAIILLIVVLKIISFFKSFF